MCSRGHEVMGKLGGMDYYICDDAPPGGIAFPDPFPDFRAMIPLGDDEGGSWGDLL